MSGKIIRLGSVFILVMILLSVSLVIVSESALAYSWNDEFYGPGLNPRWTRGGIGTVSINTESSCLFAKSYTGESPDDWHGPFIRAQIPGSGDFDISAEFRCFAEEQQMNRLMIRLFDQSGAQLFSFGWSDVHAADSKAEIGLYGSSFSSPIFKTESYSYTTFYDKNISLARSGQNLSFYIEDSLVFSDTSSQTPVYSLAVAFLKYRNICTLDLYMNRISVTTGDAGGTVLPGAPENLDISPGNEYAYLSWSPPADSGGLPITNYKIYRGNATGNESYLTTIDNILYYNDTGLTNDQEYYYKVSAVNSLGEGPAVSESATPSSNTSDDPPDDPIDDPADDPIDTDDDGTGDDTDAFPDDPAASVDTDDDGMPDYWNEGYTEEDSTSGLEVDDDDDNDGIPDTEDPDDDNDGIPDIEEDDLTSWKDNFTINSSIITLIVLLVGIIIMILYMKSGDNSGSSKDPKDGSSKDKDNKSRKRRT